MSIPKFIPKLILVAAAAVWPRHRRYRRRLVRRRRRKVVLDQLCEARGGTPYSTPYSITRCQFARANKGFETERRSARGSPTASSSSRSAQPHEPGVVGLFPTSPPA